MIKNGSVIRTGVEASLLSTILPFKPSEQRVADAIVAVEAGRNLKEQFAYKVDVTQEIASVRYTLVGLDRDSVGACSASGSASITANFIVNQPADRNGSTASIAVKPSP